MSVITIDDETFTVEVHQSKIPVVLAFISDNKASGRMKDVLDKLAQDLGGKVKVAQKKFEATGLLEKNYDVQSAPTTLLIQTETVVGQYSFEWFKNKIESSLNL
jgi:thioredoxin-like negative regulator of GroEL